MKNPNPPNDIVSILHFLGRYLYTSYLLLSLLLGVSNASLFFTYQKKKISLYTFPQGLPSYKHLIFLILEMTLTRILNMEG